MQYSTKYIRYLSYVKISYVSKDKKEEHFFDLVLQ